MNNKARVHLLIHGRVQGVFFRYETKKTAESLDLTGWVKNNPDNTVECVAEGEKDKLEKLVKWCNEGSDSAKVEKVDVKWTDYKGEFVSFDIR